MICVNEKIADIIYRGDNKIHHIKPEQPIFVVIHQTHVGEPYISSFSVSAYPCPPEQELKDELLVELLKSKQSLSGYTRILLAKVID